MLEDVQGMPPLNDIEFVRVNCSPLLGAMKDEAIAWLHSIGSMMRSFEQPIYQVLHTFTALLPWEGCKSSLDSIVWGSCWGECRALVQRLCRKAGARCPCTACSLALLQPEPGASVIQCEITMLSNCSTPHDVAGMGGSPDQPEGTD
jgi:hypothetical protein